MDTQKQKAIDLLKDVIALMEEFPERYQITMPKVAEALAALESEPAVEPSEFTSSFRKLIKLSEEHLSNNKIGRLRTYGRDACDLINHQAATIKSQAAEIRTFKKRIDWLLSKPKPSMDEPESRLNPIK